MYYINLGAIKILWGASATISTTTTATQYNVTLPTGFFTTTQMALVSCLPISADSKQVNNIASIGTTNLGIYMWSSVAATAQAQFLVIGS